MWWNRISWRRAASSNTYVPVTFVLRNGEASRIELSLCDSAAKCTMASIGGTAAAERWFSPENRDSTSSASQILPCTKVRFAAGTPSRFSRLPAYVSASRTVMWACGWLRATQCTKFAPMNPAPPVTRMCCGANDGLVASLDALLTASLVESRACSELLISTNRNLRFA